MLSSVCLRLSQLSPSYLDQYMGLCVFSLPNSLVIIVRTYSFIVSSSSSNRKYESLIIVRGQVMKQQCALYVPPCSYQTISCYDWCFLISSNQMLKKHSILTWSISRVEYGEYIQHDWTPFQFVIRRVHPMHVRACKGLCYVVGDLYVLTCSYNIEHNVIQRSDRGCFNIAQAVLLQDLGWWSKGQ